LEYNINKTAEMLKRSHILLLNLICWLMDNTDNWIHINYQVVGII